MMGSVEENLYWVERRYDELSPERQEHFDLEISDFQATYPRATRDQDAVYRVRVMRMVSGIDSEPYYG